MLAQRYSVYSRSLYTRKRFYVCLAFTSSLLYLANTIYHVTQSHLFDLNISELYNKTLAVYLLTTDCQRYTSDILTQFDDLEAMYLVNDIDSPECLATGHKLLNFDLHNDTRYEKQDEKYRAKWAHVMKHCGQGARHKCLILEDDVIFIHDKEKTREVILTQTLTLWFSGNLAWDCARRGFGWFKTPGYGWGSQCRVFEKNERMSECVAKCFIESEGALDMVIGGCQHDCTIDQGNFLLVQHAELGSEFHDRGTTPRFWDVEGWDHST